MLCLVDGDAASPVLLVGALVDAMDVPKKGGPMAMYLSFFSDRCNCSVVVMLGFDCKQENQQHFFCFPWSIHSCVHILLCIQLYVQYNSKVATFVRPPR